MSLFESASLVVTPNGAKASKLYAIKPTSGAGDLSVTRATTATRVNSAGLIESVASNVPRLDYTNGSCPSILVEPQRTNLFTYSNTFTDASWNLEDATISANVAISPDGTQNASKLVSNANNTDHTIYKNVLTLVDRTFSCYVKADGYNYVFLGNNNGLASNGVFFNLTNGTISQNTSTFTASIKSAGNGWYRCEISQSLWLLPYAMICLSNNGTSFTFAGNGTSGVLIYGAQNEAGSYATSYIKTEATTVTRNADLINKTGISSLIGQTEGTIFVDFYRNSQAESIGIMLANALGTNSYMNSIYLFQVANNLLTCDCFVSNSQQFSLQLAGGLSNGRHKLALAYKQNDAVLYVDGVQIDTDTSCNIPPMTSIDISQEFAASNYKNNTTALWKTRLTNAELAELTTI
jgi:hypothetical protein